MAGKMSKFSKIVILILLLLSFFFIKEKYGNEIQSLIANINTQSSSIKTMTKEPEIRVKENTETPNKESLETKETVTVYFLALDSHSNGIYKKVQRELPKGEDKLEYAIKELLKGPNIVEKSTGAYSEIPAGTKLLKIQQKGKEVIIDLNSDFQYGGGTDSVYSRMMQLIKTSLANTKGKKIYLYLDGSQVNFIGGEGIMITQPLNEKSLEV